MKTFPTKEAILEWIKDNPRTTSKRDVAKAFGIKGDDRIELKRILRELREDGHLTKSRNTIREAGSLQNVELLQITAIDADGDLFAEPANWKGEEHAPSILIVPKKGDPALGIGDKILCRITKTGEEHAPYEGRLIRKIGSAAAVILGIYKQADYGGRVIPVDKKSSKEWQIAPGDRNGAREGELVEATQIGKVRMGLPKAKITARLGDATAPKSVSLIAIHEHGIPVTFPDKVEEEALKAKPVKLGKREDLRHLPLFTIDPSDARDHDDAICALPDTDPKNEAATSSGSPSPTSPTTCARTRRWIARLASAGIRLISPTVSCQCCPTVCPATCVHYTKALIAPASHWKSSLTRRAAKSTTVSPAP